MCPHLSKKFLPKNSFIAIFKPARAIQKRPIVNKIIQRNQEAET